MHMHCFFKFFERINPHVNSLSKHNFKKENTKTLTYNFSSVMV